MRLHDILRADVEAVIARPAKVEADDRRNPRLSGFDHRGRAIIAVIAVDDPNLVITTFLDD